MLSADCLKKSLGIDKFENIVIACGDDYPDALTGSYLAKVKNAPILLVDRDCESEIKTYILNNLDKDGNIYILGGKNVVSSKFENDLKSNYTTIRLAGNDRYGTNLAIIKEAGINSEDILVCSGNSFADSLSASAVGRPIILVDDRLSLANKEYLKNSSIKNVYLIGGTAAVNNNIKIDCSSYGKVIRIAGKNRYTTSLAVARGFFGDWSKNIVFARALDFPDGLSGGPLAGSINTPLILIENNEFEHARYFTKNIGITRAIVLGGARIISDEVVNKVIN